MYVLLVTDTDTGQLVQIARGTEDDMHKLLNKYSHTFAFVTKEA